jgi:hypothetical protein
LSIAISAMLSQHPGPQEQQPELSFIIITPYFLSLESSLIKTRKKKKGCMLRPNIFSNIYIQRYCAGSR